MFESPRGFGLGGFFWGVYPFFWLLRLAVSPLRRVTFSKRRKGNPKGLLLRAARSLGLGVPSFRDRSGRSAYGLLRCTSSRCVRLRRTVAALPRPDQSLHSAFRRRPWIKIKSCSRANAHPVEWGGFAADWCRSCRRLGQRSDDLLILLLLFCGSEPARESGLPADLSLPDVPGRCGSWLASDGGLQANQSLTECTQSLWEPACWRWRPVRQPFSN